MASFELKRKEMDPTIRQMVEFLNPWLEEPSLFQETINRQLPKEFIHRKVLDELSEMAMNSKKAHLVIGPRQAGKSTIIWALARQAKHLLYLNCEEPLVRQWCTSPARFVHEAADFLPLGGVLFLEEAQWLDEAGLFVKGVVDAKPGWVILVTGSASFHLLSRTRESLAGRTTRHNVWPLSLLEITGQLDPGTPAVRTMKRRSAFERMLVWGSYPEVVTSHHPQVILSQLLTSFVLRDASDRFRITRPDAFRLALRLGAGQIGDMVNYSEYASILGISQPTAREYFGIMEETHIIRRIRPFIGGRRAELTSAPKLFFIDNGLRNAVSGGFEPLEHRNDIGKLMENWIFSELHKRYPQPGDIRYWRTKGGAEMDFVLEPRPGLLFGIECKAQKHNHPRLSRSARSFIKAYEPVQQLIFTRGQPYEEQMGKTLIRYLPAESVSEVLSLLSSLTSI